MSREQKLKRFVEAAGGKWLGLDQAAMCLPRIWADSGIAAPLQRIKGRGEAAARLRAKIKPLFLSRSQMVGETIEPKLVRQKMIDAYGRNLDAAMSMTGSDDPRHDDLVDITAGVFILSFAEMRDLLADVADAIEAADAD